MPPTTNANQTNEYHRPVLQKRLDALSIEFLEVNPAFKSYWDRVGKSWVIKIRNRVDKPHSHLQTNSTKHLKLVGTWMNASDFTVRTNGVPLIISRFNCSTTWDVRWNGNNWGARFQSIANELFVSAVDRALGLNSVPTGRIVTLRPKDWARLFAKHVCSTQPIVRDYLNEIGANRSVSVGWLQTLYDHLKSPSRSQPRCTCAFPNQSIVGDDYYEMRISQYVSGVCDKEVNCFLLGDGSYILLDNDCVRYKYTPLELNFCSLPHRLQAHILQQNDFERRLRHVLGLELPNFQSITPTTAAIQRFQFLQSRLRACV